MDFKVTVKHSLLSVDSIRNILASYNLSKVISCEFLTRGLNDTYVISTQDQKYIFRVYRHNWRNESDVFSNWMP
jgi:Ser/Thr protein kinase RdoA (MazF antagonist)